MIDDEICFVGSDTLGRDFFLDPRSTGRVDGRWVFWVGQINGIPLGSTYC